MRIVGEISHPNLKITIFKNGNRLSVKFEDGSVEQTYKFDDGQGIESVGDVKKHIDAAFLKNVEEGIATMKITRLSTLKRNAKGAAADEFPVII